MIVNKGNCIVREGVITKTIGACVDDEPGSGEVQLYRPDSTGEWLPDGEPLPCLNYHRHEAKAASHAIVSMSRIGLVLVGIDS